MTVIDGDRIITAQLYDDEYEEFIEKKMSIIDFINTYTNEGVIDADIFEQTKWIPISEGLPEEDKTVIASTKYGVYPEAKYTKEDGWQWAYESGADYWVELEYVEAWMPLPKSYKVKS